jgi:hypothetical protein
VLREIRSNDQEGQGCMHRRTNSPEHARDAAERGALRVTNR